MLRLPTSVSRLTEIRTSGPSRDLAMDVLQYGLAALAIAGAVLLGSLR